MICAVTGHRPNKLGGYNTRNNPHYNSIMEGLDRALLELRPERVIVGMALGVDQWMAELCLWNGIPFVAAIPFEGFEVGGHWYESNIRKYRDLLAKAAQVVPVSSPPYTPWKMQLRNEWMVDHCDVLLAVFDGTPGGTANCVSYAQQVRRTIRRIEYFRPPPVVNRERAERPRLVITDAPAVQPPQPQRPATPEQVVDAFLQSRNERPTEGQIAAQRRARREQEQEARRAERQRQIEQQRAEARARREAQDRLLAEISELQSRPAPEEVETKVEVVRDFGRFVDLDV